MKLSIHRFLLLFSILLGLNSFSQILEYSFDYESNNAISDVGILNNHAKIIGNENFVEDRNGDGCRAFLFDGNTYLSIPNDNSLNFDKEFSISVWIKLEQDKLDWITLLCKGGQNIENNNSPSYRVQLTNITASFNTKSTKDIGIVTQSFENDRWFHLVVSYSASQAIIYVDGLKRYSYFISAPLGKNFENLEIGRDIPGSTEYLIGTLDELKIFNKTLSSNEVAYIYKKSNTTNSSACPKTALSSPPSSSPPSQQFDWDVFEAPPVVSTSTKKAKDKAKQTPDWDDFEVSEKKAPIKIDWDDFEELRIAENESNPNIDIDWEDFDWEEPELDTMRSELKAEETVKILVPKNQELEARNQAYKKKLAELNIQERVITSFKALIITLYDHKTIDGDTVNIYLNDSLIISNYELKAITNKAVLQLPVKFLKPFQSNFISVEALNFGSTGVKLNTVAISIYDGKEVTLKELDIRKIKEKVTLEILYKP
jgi:hypothetical protein